MGLRFTPALAINPPQLDYIEEKIIHFKPHTEQIEVFKFTKHKHEDHKSKTKTYTNRIGKRYRPFMHLKKDQNVWIFPTKLFLKGKHQNYFKFCFRGPDGTRTGLSSFTLTTTKVPSPRIKLAKS